MRGPAVPQSQPTADDLRFLQRAVDISRHALEDEGNTPFGAIVVIDGKIVGEGTSSVVKLHDPTAHAEVMALRAAGEQLGRHIFDDAVMYASSEPCPMCLVASCYWARIPRLLYAATSHDVATHGFEDLQIYRQLTLPAPQRAVDEIAVEGPIKADAVAVLKQWSDSLLEPVVPKF
jgi:tRNA(Arg) A34 adenosine deaminase TadA